jgi:cyclophilin family peptidyl-prolyl cis-trans isomerase
MLDRIRLGRFQPRWPSEGINPRTGRRTARQPLVEVLEGRQLLTASLAPISNQTVPAQQGLTLPLDGTGTTDDQTFTVTSSNPDVGASIASGDFWTLDVNYNGSPSSFSGPLTFQLFGNLTPNTVSNIENFTNDGYYNDTGMYITRIVNNFPDATDFVIQGGAPNPDGEGSSNQPGTPFPNENLQQLAFTGTDQLAMANAGVTTAGTNDTQFFITTGSPNSELGYNYTIFGQLVPNPTSETSAQTLLSDLTAVPVTTNASGEDSLPIVEPTYSASLSTANPSGALIIDTTQATAGETSTITVTATDPTDGTTTSQSFLVTVGAYTGPTASNLIQTINFKPLANPTTATTSADTSTSVTLNGAGTFPVSGVAQDLTYTLLSQPAHGTITNFNSATGTLTYTPAPGYMGPDTFQYDVTSAGPNTTAPAATSNTGTVTVTVGAAAPVVTGAVQLVGNTLLITPVPHAGHVTNYVDVIQVPSTATSTTPVIEVYVNNQLDTTQPLVSDLEDIVVYGTRAARNIITIDPSVTVPAVISGGHGFRNKLKAGSTETLEQSWFGHTVMVGGSGPNQLIGKAGQVKFKPTSSTDLIFAGSPQRRTALLNPTPPQGTFYVYKKGKLIAVPLSSVYPSSAKTVSRPIGKVHHDDDK